MEVLLQAKTVIPLDKCFITCGYVSSSLPAGLPYCSGQLLRAVSADRSVLRWCLWGKIIGILFVHLFIIIIEF